MVAILVERFYYLKTALAFLLIFIGIKLGLQEIVGKLDPLISLAVIASILLTGMIASLIHEKKKTGHW